MERERHTQIIQVDSETLRELLGGPEEIGRLAIEGVEKLDLPRVISIEHGSLDNGFVSTAEFEDGATLQVATRADFLAYNETLSTQHKWAGPHHDRLVVYAEDKVKQSQIVEKTEAAAACGSLNGERMVSLASLEEFAEYHEKNYRWSPVPRIGPGGLKFIAEYLRNAYSKNSGLNAD